MRLTKSIKEEIIIKVLREAISERKARNDKQEYSLAIECRDKFAGKHLDALLSLPGNMVETGTGCSVNIDGRWIVLKFNSELKREPCPDGRHVVNSKSALGKKILKWSDERDAINKDRGALRREIRTLLDSVTTDKKLLEVWPEAEKYIPKEPAPAYPLAVRPQDLNKKIEAAKKAS